MELDYLRLLSSFITGVMISQSGSLIQGVTRNVLASPSTLGFQAIVVLLVLLVNAFGIALELEYSSLLFGLVLILLLALLYREKKKKVFSNRSKGEMNTFLLIGLGINLLVGAIFSIWHFYFLALNKEFPSQIWFGHFRFVDETLTYTLCALFFVTSLFTFPLLKKLQLLSLGNQFFTALGEDLFKVQKRVILIVFVQTLIIISFFGVFSFAALIIPLLLKRFHFFAKNLFNEVVWGGLLGGLFFMLLDLFCYEVTFYGAELPVGMLSSTIGSIVMVSLLIKQKLQE